MDRKSISAYAIFIGGGAISWLSKKQATISLSSTEAEYKALTTCTKEMLWIKRMLLDLHLLDSKKTPIIYCDNLSAQSLAANPVFHARSKHIEIAHHFVRDQVIAKEVELQHVSTKECVADIFTKPLGKEPFIKHRSSLGMYSKSMFNLEGKVEEGV